MIKKKLFKAKLVLLALFLGIFALSEVAEAAYPSPPTFNCGCMHFTPLTITDASNVQIYYSNVTGCGQRSNPTTAITLEKGATYTVSTHGGYGWGNCCYALWWRAWIDWDGNEDFSDAGELTWNLSFGYADVSFQFTVPDVAEGNTFRMRIVGHYSGWGGAPNYTGTDPNCYGDYADILFNVPKPPSDAGITAITQPSGAFTKGTQNIAVNLKNFAQKELTSCHIIWRIDEGLPTESSNTFMWSGSLGQDEDEEVVVGTYDFNSNRQYTIDAFTEAPNDDIDVDPTNDAAMQRRVAPALSPKVYVIGGSTPDFPSINAATTYLSQAGIVGDGTLTLEFATLELINPPYNDHFVLGSYPSTGDNDLLITSATGDPKDVRVYFEPTATYTYLASINGARNVTIKGITFITKDVNGLSGIMDFQASTNITVQNNILNNQTSALQDNYHTSINLSGCYNVTINNNKINDGAIGISETSICPRKIQVTNNTFTDVTWKFTEFFGNSGGVPCTENNVVVNGNDFISTTGAPIGLMSTNGTEITNNIFSGFVGNSATDAVIYVTNNDPTNFTNQTLIQNNQMTGGLIDVNGIYALNVPNLMIKDNDVKVTDHVLPAPPGAVTNGIFISNSGSTITPVYITHNKVEYNHSVNGNTVMLSNSNVRINTNDFDLTSSGASIYAVNASQCDGYIANSQIGATDASCLYLDNSNLGVYYNSIANQSAGRPTVNINGGAGAFERNLVQNMATGPAINATGAGLNTLDENNYFTNGAVFGSWSGVSTADLTEWQTNSGQDANSTSIEVQFNDFSTFDLGLNWFDEHLVFDDPLSLGDVEDEIQGTDYNGNTRYGYFMGSENIIPEIHITNQPTSIMDCYGALGQKVSVTAFVTKGVQPRFEWFKDGVSLTTLYKNPGTDNWAQKAHLYLNETTFADTSNPGLNSQMEGTYRCKVMGSGAEPQWTDFILVNVLYPAVITRQPEDQRVNLGDNVLFEVEAHIVADEGKDDPLYQPDIQWYKGPIGSALPLVDDLSNYGHISGAQSNILSIRNITDEEIADDYYVVLKGACNTLTSSYVSIRQFPNVFITEEPSNVVECEGQAVNFSVTAEATDAGATIEYQWRLNSVAIDGATNKTFTIDAITPDDEGSYDCVVTVLPGGKTETSDPATLALKYAPTVTKQPADQNAQVGEPFALFILATGEEPLTYQWYQDSVVIDGATSSSFTVNSATFSDGGNYTCEVTNECGSIMSDPAIVSVSNGGFVGVSDAMTGGFTLENAPNPFEETTNIRFYVPRTSAVRLTITDVYGKQLGVLANRTFTIGWNEWELSASQYHLSSGVYYYTLTSGQYSVTQKLVIVR